MLFFILAACVLGLARAECQDGTIIASGLTCEEKQLIVDLHNELRNQVASGELETQPSAADMIEMRWSEPVAETAQTWGDRCVFEHDPDRNLDGEQLGQNLAIWAYSVRLNRSDPESRMKDIRDLVKLWSDEVKEYGYNGTYETETGHYSQMIWGSTTHVGCGLTYYDKQGTFFIYLVCNYSPPGNWIGLPPYIYGNQTCDEYNMYESTSYSDLCATDKKKVLVCNNTEKKKIDEGVEHTNISSYNMNAEGEKTEDLQIKENKNEEGEKTEDLQIKENKNEEGVKIAEDEMKDVIKKVMKGDINIEDGEKKEKDAKNNEDIKKGDLIEEGVKKVQKESEESLVEESEENIEKKANCICK